VQKKTEHAPAGNKIIKEEPQGENTGLENRASIREEERSRKTEKKKSQANAEKGGNSRSRGAQACTIKTAEEKTSGEREATAIRRYRNERRSGNKPRNLDWENNCDERILDDG